MRNLLLLLRASTARGPQAGRLACLGGRQATTRDRAPTKRRQAPAAVFPTHIICNPFIFGSANAAKKLSPIQAVLGSSQPHKDL